MTPREVFERMTSYWIDGEQPGLWAPDLVVETPFARPGAPARVEGGEKFKQIARAGRAALPVTFERCDIIAFHETTDPAVSVVEYELVASLNATGARHSARFIAVMTVRDGKVVHWREYQDTARIDAALAGA